MTVLNSLLGIIAYIELDLAEGSLTQEIPRTMIRPSILRSLQYLGLKLREEFFHVFSYHVLNTYVF